MAGYPSRQELFALGLPARAFARQPVMVSAVDADADVLTVRAHGLSNGDRVRLELTPTIPGATPSALPAGLSASILYYVVGVDELGSDMLQLALTDGGSPVNLTDAGTPPFGVALDLGARIDFALDAWSRHADQYLTDYSTPLVTAPLQLKMWVCQLTAYDLAVTQGLADPEFAKDPALATRAEGAQKRLDEFGKGTPLAGFVVDQTPNDIENAARGFGDELRCWTPPGGFL